MFRPIVALLCILPALTANAKGFGGDIQVETFSDFVMLNMHNEGFDMAVQISGPAGFMESRMLPGSGAAYIDVVNAKGQRLADGLYKYEIKPVPAVSLSREESAAMVDRNVLVGKSADKVSPVSGSFYIVGGQIMDAQMTEAGGAQ
jgi:hypothetical protein